MLFRSVNQTRVDGQGEKLPTELQETQSYKTILRQGIQAFKDHTILQYLAFDLIGFSAISWIFYWIFQLTLDHLAIPLQYWGIINTGAILGHIGLLNSVKIWEKMGNSKKSILVISGLTLSLSSLLCAIFINTVWVCIVCIILGMAFGPIRAPLLNSYMNKYIASEQRATVLSLVSMIDRAFLMIFNLIMGAFAEDHLRIAYLTLAILGFFILLFSQVKESHLQD